MLSKNLFRKLWKIREALASLFTGMCVCCGKHCSGTSGVCGECQKELLNITGRSFPESFYSRAVSAGFYSGKAKTVMIKFKFGEGFERLVPEMLAMLAAAFEREYPAESFDYVIPVPSYSRDSESTLRLAELTRLFCRYEGLCFGGDILKKVRQTKRQHDLSAEERRTNLIGAFEAGETAAGKRILLIDDIFTTGSTALECSKALIQKGASEVSVLTVLKTEFEG